MLLIISGCVSKDEQFNFVVDQLISGSVPAVKPSDIQRPDLYQIIDARSVAEFNVSHIKGAQFVDYDRLDSADFSDLQKEKDILVYCTVGYRSEKVGEKLKSLGYDNVYNLYGGIIQWKNDGLPVVNPDGIQTDSLHGYSPLWGKWIKKGIPVYD
jgi:rhodanese-related sulfurtransferase